LAITFLSLTINRLTFSMLLLECRRQRLQREGAVIVERSNEAGKRRYGFQGLILIRELERLASNIGVSI